VSYDNSVVSYDHSFEGSLFSESSFPSFPYYDMPAADTIVSGNCLLGYDSFFIPPGELTNFVFEGNRIGDSPINIETIRIWDINRNEIQSQIGTFGKVYVRVRTDSDPVITADKMLKVYPNPFNPVTTICFEITVKQKISLRIYEASGRLLIELADDVFDKGFHKIQWNGTDMYKSTVSSGVYFCRLKPQSFNIIRKIVLLK